MVACLLYFDSNDNERHDLCKNAPNVITMILGKVQRAVVQLNANSYSSKIF